MTVVEDTLEVVRGVGALKDKYRYSKLKAGDMRGMSIASRFRLGKKFGITEAQIAFDSIAPRFGDHKGKVEIEASIYSNGKSHGSVYNIKDLIEAVNDESPCSYVTIQFVVVRWNKKGTDADRKNTGEEFQFIN